jgi:hypothetical protein
MAETVRTFERRLGWPARLAAYFQSELQSHFGDAWVTGYGPLVDRMANDQKDRHVLAVAVSCGAPIIVTMNVRHFRREHLGPWGVVARHPESFLSTLYRQEPALVVKKLLDQAADRNRSLPELLNTLAKTVPGFVELVLASQ